MFVSQALAHGASGADSPGGLGPIILLAVAVLFVLVLVGERKWREYKLRHGGGDEKHSPLNGKP
jgi:hypothetical protein